MTAHINHHDCSCTVKSTPYSQTLDEMDFERGIWFAAMNGEAEKVQKYLDKNSAPDALDAAGYTALHYACRHGHLNVCKLLLKSGANPNILTRAGKASPLHRAAHCGHIGIVNVLIEYRAKLELHDSDGQTALHKASKQSHPDVIKLLLKHQPQLSSSKDKWGKFPVDYITESNKDLRVLLKPSVEQ